MYGQIVGWTNCRVLMQHFYCQSIYNSNQYIELVDKWKWWNIVPTPSQISRASFEEIFCPRLIVHLFIQHKFVIIFAVISYYLLRLLIWDGECCTVSFFRWFNTFLIFSSLVKCLHFNLEVRYPECRQSWVIYISTSHMCFFYSYCI